MGGSHDRVSGSTVSTEGKAGGRQAFARSTASLARAEIVAGLTTLVSVEGAQSECRATGTGVSGSTTIGTLIVGGQVLRDLRPNTNTELSIPGIGTLVLNEQVITRRPPTATAPGRTEIAVNAIRLRLLPNSPLGSGDIVLAQSACAIEGPTVM